MSIELITLGLSIFGAKKSYDANAQAAKEKAEVGKLEGRQFVNELFLGKAQAIGAANARRQQLTEAETSNIALLGGKYGRDDRSVEALLKRNEKVASEDIADINRASALLSAKYATQAAVSYTYGQNAAAGLRAQGTANLLTDMANIAKNLSPSLLPGKPQNTVTPTNETG